MSDGRREQPPAGRDPRAFSKHALEELARLTASGFSVDDAMRQLPAFKGITLRGGGTEHLKLSYAERASSLERDYPDGFPIYTMPASSLYMKWRSILPFELFIMRHHSQTLPALLVRGGLSPQEIWAAGANTDKKSDQEILDILKEDNALMNNSQ